jgi:hypothetical protein
MLTNRKPSPLWKNYLFTLGHMQLSLQKRERTSSTITTINNMKKNARLMTFILIINSLISRVNTLPIWFMGQNSLVHLSFNLKAMSINHHQSKSFLSHYKIWAFKIKILSWDMEVFFQYLNYTNHHYKQEGRKVLVMPIKLEIAKKRTSNSFVDSSFAFHFISFGINSIKCVVISFHGLHLEMEKLYITLQHWKQI